MTSDQDTADYFQDQEVRKLSVMVLCPLLGYLACALIFILVY